MCYVVKPAAVSGVDHTRRFLLLTEIRVVPLIGGRFSAYARFVGNEDGDGNNLRSTIVLNGILILATIITTNLPVVTTMLRKPNELDTECGQNEMPSVVRRTLPDPGEEVPSGHEEFGPPKTPPPKKALPRLPQESVMEPMRLQQPPLPLPSPLQEHWDGRSTHSTTHGVAATPRVWPSFD
jgi:hypothetical protein